MFIDLIGEVSLIDPPLVNSQFTWSNFREDLICCRMDRFLIFGGWEGLFKYVRQEAVVRVVSDHCSIILDSNPPNWGPIPFCFENIWLDHKDFGSYFLRMVE